MRELWIWQAKKKKGYQYYEIGEVYIHDALNASDYVMGDTYRLNNDGRIGPPEC